MNEDALSALAGDLAALLDGLRDESGRRIMSDLARSADPGDGGVVRIDLLRGSIAPAGLSGATLRGPLTSVRRMVDQLTVFRGGNPRTLSSATVEVRPHASGLPVPSEPESGYLGRLEVTDSTGRRGWAEVRG